jgi:carboxypeptidase C (cathepsin A)
MKDPAHHNKTKICETTPAVKSYSGYITIPASADPSLQPYDANMFFWFFEARDSPLTAPLTLWLQGGPGSASTVQAVSGHNGPCAVQSDSNSTVLNPWSWNNVANVLYLDQPMQVGYSYDVATEGTMDMMTGVINPGQVNSSTYLLRKGVFASQDMRRTANTTAIATKAIQEFLDLWLDR